MNIETIDSSERLFSLRQPWNELLESSASNCVFLTHEWLSTWWKHLAGGRRLSVFAAWDDGKLIGVLPVAERSAQYARMMPRVLEFVGSGLIGSDYLDAIIKGGCEAQVSAAFSEHLHNRGLMLQLSQLRRETALVRNLAESLRAKGWLAADTKLNICPYINLTGLAWPTYVSGLGANIRKNLNRYLRLLPTNFEMEVDCVKDVERAESALATVIELHEKRWRRAGTSEAFQSPAVNEFHREFVRLAAERNWLRILILRLNGQAAASLYALRYGPTFYFYQSGFDPAFSKHSVGVATMGLSIKTAIEEGALEYDFLHGDEEYKFHWASAKRDLGRLELYPTHARGRLYRHAIHLNRAARQMARRVLLKA
jgi:CelD/BcsL family acetyltransferase involved in cellulose biosynthesis